MRPQEQQQQLSDVGPQCCCVVLQALHQLQQLVSDSWQDLASHHDLLWFLRQR